MTRMRDFAVIVAAAALLAGCGGGGVDTPADDSPEAALAQLPASAGESSAGLVSYLRRLHQALAQGEGVEPLALAEFAPPTSEDAEPEAVQ